VQRHRREDILAHDAHRRRATRSIRVVTRKIFRGIVGRSSQEIAPVPLRTPDIGWSHAAGALFRRPIAHALLRLEHGLEDPRRGAVAADHRT